MTLEPSASGSIFVLMIPATWTCTVELFGTCGVLNRHSKWQYGPSGDELCSTSIIAMLIRDINAFCQNKQCATRNDVTGRRHC